MDSVIKQLCVLGFWLGGDSGLSFTVVGMVFVEQRFFCSCFKWPFGVGIEVDRCLEIILIVRPVHLIKSPFFIA